MPEDTPGNPGVLFAGPDDESGDDAEEGFAAEGGDFFPVGTEEGAPPSGDRVRGMQAKLHRWAGDDASRRFDDLWNLVCDYDFLARSWDLVRSNRGARTPGVDGVRAVDVQFRDGGVSGFLEEIRGQLRDGTYRPSAARRVEIPKANGKLRKLGIPTVADKVVQGALKLVLEPVFEADFLPCSYGFRPNRRAQDAIAEIHHYASHGYTVALEADIRSCFDEIDHNALMERVRRRIKDKRVLALVKAFLKAGVMTAVNYFQDSLSGTPQGGIISPLLANVALSALDEHFDQRWQDQMGTKGRRQARRRKGLANMRLIRYCDDFVVMVHGNLADAEGLRAEVAAVLAPVGLRLAEEKTRAVSIDEGFDFLGFTIRRMRKRGTKEHYVYTMPSRKSIQKARDKVAEMTYRSTINQDFKDLLVSLNKSLEGWANYFRHGVSSAAFSTVDHYAWNRIMRWLRRKYKSRSLQGHSALGMPELRRRFCLPGTWIFAVNGVRYTGAGAVEVKRYLYRGFQIPTPWTPQPETAARAA
jgi:RNA-directed DNA polymerase